MVLTVLVILTFVALAVLLLAVMVLMFKYGNYPWSPKEHKRVGWLWIAIGACVTAQNVIAALLGVSLRLVPFLLVAGIALLAWLQFRRANKLMRPLNKNE
ncbi:hypothetical protein HYT45_01375 [Candidatus Uhrbacteria bacterium]|nr:hypothetical protein [Candidatus Uhrbacteria bacterium]